MGVVSTYRNIPPVLRILGSGAGVLHLPGPRWRHLSGLFASGAIAGWTARRRCRLWIRGERLQVMSIFLFPVLAVGPLERKIFTCENHGLLRPHLEKQYGGQREDAKLLRQLFVVDLDELDAGRVGLVVDQLDLAEHATALLAVVTV